MNRIALLTTVIAMCLAAPIALRAASHARTVDPGAPPGLPAEKADEYKPIQGIIEAAPGYDPSLPPGSTPELPRPTGVISDPSSPYPAAEYTITNAWQGTVGGTSIAVYAGSEGSNLSQGMIVVTRTSSATGAETAGVELPTSDLNGPLTITGATSTGLALQAASGANYRFDTATTTLVRTN